MRAQKSLRLPCCFELPHHPLSHPSRLVGLLCPIVRVLLSAVDRVGNQLPMGNAITTQFIRHDFPEFVVIIPQQASKETLRSSTIPFSLQIHINHVGHKVCRFLGCILDSHATENPMARTAAGYRSGIDEHEVQDH